jgi:hypothetical protein
MSSAAVVNDTGKSMGKQFLVWYIPDLANDPDFGALGVKFIAAQAQNKDFIWLGYGPQPWGPFTQVLNKSIDIPGVDNGTKFTAQLLPSPVIKRTGPKRFTFPLAFSGDPPTYDGFFIGKAVFRLG